MPDLLPPLKTHHSRFYRPIFPTFAQMLDVEKQNADCVLNYKPPDMAT